MTTWYVVVGLGIGGALALGFVYILFMRFCAGCVVWTSIVGILCVIFAVGAWCYIKSGWIPSEWIEFVTDQLNEMGIMTAFVVEDTFITNGTIEVLQTLDIDISEYTAVRACVRACVRALRTTQR